MVTSDTMQCVIGTILEVEEKEKLVVHFTNENERPVFVYVFCLEETG